MKRTRAQQPKAPEPQDPAVAEAGNPKPQRRAKQPKGAAKKPAASPVPDTALTVCFAEGEEAAGAGTGTGPQPMDWDLETGVGAWSTWGVDEDKLLGWFPFVEEDFRCLAGPAFDDDIWRIHQIYEIPNYAAM